MFIYFPLIRNMEEEEGDHEAYQSGGSSLLSGATMGRAQPPPGVSPSSIDICRAYHGEYC